MKRNKIFLLVVSFTAVILFGVGFGTPWYVDKAVAEDVDSSVYLPVILRQYPPALTVFGLQMNPMTEDG